MPQKRLLKSKLGEERRGGERKGAERRREERKERKERREEEQACYVTPLSVHCLSQCSDVSFLTALVSNLASLLFLAPGRQPERDY